MELPFTTCPSSLFSREHDIYNHTAHRKMIVINNENLISIHFDFLKISYFLITKKIEFMTYYGTLSYLHFQELKSVDTDQDVSIWISFDNVSVLHIKPQSSEKKINITISLHMYQIMLAYFHLTAYLKKGLQARNDFSCQTLNLTLNCNIISHKTGIGKTILEYL